MKHKLVIVEWFDAHSIDGWEPLEGEKKNVKCTSVGWLISDTKDNIVIVPNIADKGENKFDGCGKMIIPKVSIVSKRNLKP